jgi:hypothetical protein
MFRRHRNTGNLIGQIHHPDVEGHLGHRADKSAGQRVGEGDAAGSRMNLPGELEEAERSARAGRFYVN